MTALKENDEMNKLNAFLKNKKGSFSILFVILAFIALLIITATVDIVRQAYVLNEVQGVMDVAGVSAIRGSVEEETLRGEEFVFSRDFASTKYQEIVNSRVKPGDFIVDKTLKIDDIHYEYSNQGLGQNAGSAHQVWMDSYMIMTVKTSPLFDMIPSLEKRFYKSYNSERFTVTANGESENGEKELIIRSVSRVVYR